MSDYLGIVVDRSLKNEDFIKLSRIDAYDKGRIFEYIGKLAYEYDRKLMENTANYTSRYDHISAYLERSRRCLPGDPSP